MRFMVIVKANKDSEAGVLPKQKLLAEMGKFNEELVKAGVLLAGEGLHASAKGKRVRFSGAKRTVIDGPFTETNSRRRTSVPSLLPSSGSRKSACAPRQPLKSRSRIRPFAGRKKKIRNLSISQTFIRRTVKREFTPAYQQQAREQSTR